MKKVRAKFWITGIQHQSPKGSEHAQVATVTMQPVYAGIDGENADWSKYTPSGKIEMCVTNPDAIEAFELGASYFVDFTPAD